MVQREKLSHGFTRICTDQKRPRIENSKTESESGCSHANPWLRLFGHALPKYRIPGHLLLLLWKLNSRAEFRPRIETWQVQG